MHMKKWQNISLVYKNNYGFKLKKINYNLNAFKN